MAPNVLFWRASGASAMDFRLLTILPPSFVVLLQIKEARAVLACVDAAGGLVTDELCFRALAAYATLKFALGDNGQNAYFLIRREEGKGPADPRAKTE